MQRKRHRKRSTRLVYPEEARKNDQHDNYNNSTHKRLIAKLDKASANPVSETADLMLALGHLLIDEKDQAKMLLSAIFKRIDANQSTLGDDLTITLKLFSTTQAIFKFLNTHKPKQHDDPLFATLFEKLSMEISLYLHFIQPNQRLSKEEKASIQNLVAVHPIFIPVDNKEMQLISGYLHEIKLRVHCLRAITQTPPTKEDPDHTKASDPLFYEMLQLIKNLEDSHYFLPTFGLIDNERRLHDEKIKRMKAEKAADDHLNAFIAELDVKKARLKGLPATRRKQSPAQALPPLLPVTNEEENKTPVTLEVTEKPNKLQEAYHLLTLGEFTQAFKAYEAAFQKAKDEGNILEMMRALFTKADCYGVWYKSECQANKSGLKNKKKKVIASLKRAIRFAESQDNTFINEEMLTLLDFANNDFAKLSGIKVTVDAKLDMEIANSRYEAYQAPTVKLEAIPEPVMATQTVIAPYAPQPTVIAPAAPEPTVTRPAITETTTIEEKIEDKEKEKEQSPSLGARVVYSQPLYVPPTILHLMSYLTDSYVVGGAVRDAWCGVAPREYDVVTPLTPQEILYQLQSRGYQCQLMGQAFPLVLVHTPEGKIEIATFRAKPPEQPTASYRLHAENGTLLHNSHYGLSIEEDSDNRDFFINALYYNPRTKCTLACHPQTLQDLDSQTIRTIGDPVTRFTEDPIRMLRAIELSERTGFKLDISLIEAIQTCKEQFKKAPMPGRVLHEMDKIFHSGCTYQIFQALDQHGLLEILFPQITSHAATDAYASALQNCITVSTNTHFYLNTDINLAFVFAVMLWPALIQGVKDTPDFDQVANTILVQQSQSVAIPQIMFSSIKAIWLVYFNEKKLLPEVTRSLSNDREYDPFRGMAGVFDQYVERYTTHALESKVPNLVTACAESLFSPSAARRQTGSAEKAVTPQPSLTLDKQQRMVN